MNYKPFLFILICLPFFQTGSGQLVPGSTDITKGYILKLKQGFHTEGLMLQWNRANKSGLDGSFKSLVPSLNIWLYNSSTPLPRTERFLALEGVEEAYPNKRVHLRSRIPDDPEYSEQWHMDMIQAPEVWDITTGGKMMDNTEIVIAIFDGGCDILHEDLAEQLWVNENEIPNDDIDNDQNGFVDDYIGWNAIEENDEHPRSSHGTAVTGIVGAKGNNSTGITGVNWNVKMMIISGANGFESEVLAGYNYIYEMRRAWNESQGAEGAFIVATNSSFGIEYFRGGTPDNHPEWCAMYDLLGSVGILNAGATINEGVDIDEVGDIPSACPSDYLITVTNTNRDDRKVSNAGYGLVSIDLGAPGDESFSTTIFDDYDQFGGTSGATPHVAGAIALLYSVPSLEFATGAMQSPAATALLVKEILIGTVDTISSLEGRSVSQGRLNLFKALNRLAGEVGNEPGPTMIRNIHPNPADDQVTIAFQSVDYETRIPLRIFNSMGAVVYSREVSFPYFGNSEVTVPTGSWPAGIYFVTLTFRDEIFTRRLVVY